MKKHNKLFVTLSAAVLFILVVAGSFTYFWDTGSPQSTCATCHEIESSSNMWAQSGHRALHCKECHGTAFSNGLHSLQEKGMMLVHHFTEQEGEEVPLTEAQILETMENCRRCHGMEYAKWTSGGHSATYAAIFLNEKHNSTEQPNADCLRCHGMFFEGAIKDLVKPLNTKGPWSLTSPEKSSQPVIPCFTCHKVHRQGAPEVPANHSDPKKIFYNRQASLPKALFYYRYEKTHVELSDLPYPTIWDGKRKIELSDDPLQRNCLQCHSPNAFHQAGTGDDRTPRGIHEGLSCLSCHDQHSNESKQSCKNCHPAISNCQLDVTKMNTTFADINSPHDIHSMRCIDCHTKGIPKKKGERE